MASAVRALSIRLEAEDLALLERPAPVHCQVYDVERDPEHPIGRNLVPFRCLGLAAKHKAEAEERLKEDAANPFSMEEFQVLGLPVPEVPAQSSRVLPQRWLKLSETEGPWAEAAKTLGAALRHGGDCRAAAATALHDLLLAVNRKRSLL